MKDSNPSETEKVRKKTAWVDE